MSQKEQPVAAVEKPRKKRKKRPPHKSKMITGYIIYASEIRKDVIKKYPDRDFGDISKLVGIEWKNLPQETKVAYEKRAQEQNAKSKAITAEAVELKKLADAAEERAREQQQATQRQTLPTMGTTTTTTVQYCNNNATSNGISSSAPHMNNINNQQQFSNHFSNSSSPAPSPTMNHHLNQNNNLNSTPQAQYQKTAVTYRTPAAPVRQRPRDASTQSESIKWVKSEPKEPPKFSQKFIDYLTEQKSVIIANLSSSADQQQQQAVTLDDDMMLAPTVIDEKVIQ